MMIIKSGCRYVFKLLISYLSDECRYSIILGLMVGYLFPTISRKQIISMHDILRNDGDTVMVDMVALGVMLSPLLLSDKDRGELGERWGVATAVVADRRNPSLDPNRDTKRYMARGHCNIERRATVSNDTNVYKELISKMTAKMVLLYPDIVSTTIVRRSLHQMDNLRASL